MPQEQHFRLTLSDAIAKYDSGDITAKGLVHFYILIKCAPGWKLKLNWRDLKDVLPIRKSAFYNAISRLKTEGAIDWEAPEGILVSVHNHGLQSTIMDSQSTIMDSQSTIMDSQSTIMDSQSTIMDSKPSKPALEKELEDRPDLYSSSIQFNYISLSENERESFLIFSRKKAASLPTPPTLIDKWIESQQKFLYAEYQEYQRKLSINCQAAKESTDLPVEPDIDPRILAALENREILEIDYNHKMFRDSKGWWHFHEWSDKSRVGDRGFGVNLNRFLGRK
jgi:hypothetical protein